MGHLDTGWAEAWASDEEDDTYDLSWAAKLPEADRPAITMLHRVALAQDSDPIDRHFQFAELERRLYHARDLYETALEEYDAACDAHDAEMAAMRDAFVAKWGKVPRLELYRQAAIRKSKQHDWEAVLYWADRGLAMYGNDAAREAAVEDLLKRRSHARAKLGAPTSRSRVEPEATATHSSVAETTDGAGDEPIAVREPADGHAGDARSVVPHDSTPSALAPAGWYEDPTTRFDHRYWDGSTWTHHVARRGERATDPI